MITLSQFLEEANGAGAKFEQKIASNVQAWLKENGLDKKFSAKRFQVMQEDDGNRAEDYSDVIVQDLENGSQFFIECKQNGNDNSVTTMFDITPELSLQPVVGVDRKPSSDELLLRLARDLQATPEFQKFQDFMQTRFEEVGDKTPGDFYFNRVDASDRDIYPLIKKYNKLVDDGKTEADCKKFDGTLIREATRNMLVIALLWRLDPTSTWDICHLEDIPYFGDLMRKHYQEDKAIAAKYLQLGDGVYMLDSSDNPLRIDCKVFPSEVLGKFDLKFTPRFGTGSMYLTPRSKMTSELPESSSFDSKKKWPKVLK